MRNSLKTGLFLLWLLACGGAISAQSKKPKKPAAETKTAAVVTAPASSPEASAPADSSVKTNARPAVDVPVGGKRNSRDLGKAAVKNVPAYFYEYTRPGFTYPRVLIEHDEAGVGKISFTKDGSDDLITDPINISAVTVSKIDEALVALAFLDSTEVYQHSRDYSHMGNTQITVKKNGRERTVKYNWTENKFAKVLMDEYRRVANEYTWRFEMAIARENQQLHTPGLMDSLDSYMKRGEISDPGHLLPFLTDLSTDERLPLMARNHAAKLIKQLEKAKK